MNDSLQQTLWNQFGASLDMLENALIACPEDVWGTEIDDMAFWFLAYHTLYWTDYYASESTPEFRPPQPFKRRENSIVHAQDRVYTKAELLGYLEFVRVKTRALIRSLTLEKATQQIVDPYVTFTLLEMVLYNMRHVQHHTAQLNLLLRQQIDSAPDWVPITEHGLED